MEIMKRNYSKSRKEPLLKRPQRQLLDGIIRFKIDYFGEVNVSIKGEKRTLKKLVLYIHHENAPLQKQIVEKLYFPSTMHTTVQTEEEQFIIAVLDLYEVDQLANAEKIIGLTGYVELSWYYSESNGQSYPRFSNWNFDPLEKRREESVDSN